MISLGESLASLRAELVQRRIGFAAAAGTATIGFDIVHIVSDVISIALLLSLAALLVAFWRIRREHVLNGEPLCRDDTKINTFLIALGGLMASLFLLVIDALPGGPGRGEDGSIILGTIEDTLSQIAEDTEVIRTQTTDVDLRTLGEEIGRRITTDKSVTTEDGAPVITYALTLPEGQAGRLTRCRLPQAVSASDVLDISLTGCRTLQVALKGPLKQALAETRPGMGSGTLLMDLNSALASAQLGFTAQHPRGEVFIPLERTMFDIINTMSAEMVSRLTVQPGAAMSDFAAEMERQFEIIEEQAQDLGEGPRKPQASSLLQRANCGPAGCIFNKPFAANDWCVLEPEGLRLAANGRNPFSLDVSPWCQPGARRGDAPYICAPAPEMFASLRPGDVVEAELLFADGEHVPFEIPVVRYGDRRGGAEPILSVEIPAREDDAPLLEVYFTRHVARGLPVIIYGGDCNGSLQVLYDSDGRGLAAASRTGFGGAPMSRGNAGGLLPTMLEIPPPIEGALRVAFENEQGERFGPWTYEIDPAALVAEAAAAAPPPSFDCGSGAAPCIGAVPISFVGVEEVVYGASPDDLSRVAEIGLRPENFFECEPCGPLGVSFEAPYQWEEVFYRLRMADGSLGPVRRVRR